MGFESSTEKSILSKSTLSWLARAVTVLAAVSFLAGAAASRTTSAAEDERKITIAAITDFHGHIENGRWVGERFEKAEEYNPGNTVLVSAGDLVGGSPYESGSQKDEPTLAMARAWGLGVSAMGNHELDRGVNDFGERISAPKNHLDWLAANIHKAGEFSRLHDYTIRIVNGKRIAFVGAVTDGLGSVLSRSIMNDVRMDGKALEQVNRVADRLSDGDERNGEADAVVALIHEDADVIARSPKSLDANVDLVYAGHTHAVKTGRHTRSGAPIVEAGSFGRQVAVQDLLVAGGGRDARVTVNDAFGTPVVGMSAGDGDPARVINAARTTNTSLERVDAIVRRADAAARRGGDIVVSSVDEPYDKTTPKGRDGLETLIADAALDGARRTVAGAGASVGFVNPGSLRTRALDLDGDGFVTVREAKDMMALQFDNAVTTLTGKQMRRVIAQQWHRRDGAWRNGHLGISSNVRYDVRFNGADAPTVEHLVVNGRPVADDDRIVVAGNTFLLTGGDGYTAFLDGTGYADTHVPYAQTLIDHMKSRGRG
ncbi:bifunctional metallophosphatase/5'-nucleotidase [Bifidobacterium sp. SMB2]|uniref:Bifunctional metallophosphatase/5'-nucleotidase n=1 Tax=Bifidobacterium saimiriisciurei TaxID=2661627 RepID=A0ABX0CAB2_9BIFI|nr:5'-nucleotidase C-terminal domain-containing protein [Bifidobacterium saimiriisciurei]NEG95858.1 bifunctional metallophosphatase/5'-nucleotidase [Bifidobacterium sp. SMB2]NEH12073.1 bifunctional metallophosphatase/5'-nucleotidase [Bifidobacterium saimiriisciurei]